MAITFEFLAFSDAHFHEHTFMAKDTGRCEEMAGINTRLVHCYDQFVHMIKYAKSHQIRCIVFCGDLLHSKKNVTKDVYNVLHKAFTLANDEGIQLVLIPGNHDYVDKEGTNHSLMHLDIFPNVSVLEFGNNVVDIKAGKGARWVGIRGVPYTECKEVLIEEMNFDQGETWEMHDFRILLSHSGMQGAKVGTDFVMTREWDLSAKDVAKDLYDICLFGHFHEHQRVFHNGWIVGAPMQFNWSDTGGTRGFMHIKLEKGVDPVVVHVPTAEHIPRFHMLNDQSDLSGVKAHDFVKYKLSEAISEDVHDRIKGYLCAVIGAVPAYVDLIPPPKTEEAALLLESGLTTTTVVDEWVSVKKSDLDEAKLLELGKALLAQARSKLE